MAQRGKKYIDATRRFDRAQVHTPAEALELVKSLSSGTSTRRSRRPSGSGSTPARPTR